MEKVNSAVASLQPELWTASSNDALTIYITDPAGSAQSFKPDFTYPIFGEAETIFGYQDLQILLCFDGVTFYPFYNVRWAEKLEDVEVDPEQKLREILPDSAVFKDESKWRDAIETEQEDFQIPGEIVGEPWKKDRDTYAVYKIDMGSEAGLELHRRLQILVLLFIEAGSYIDHEDPKWELYVTYKVTNEKLPEVVGFATAYNYWTYPGAGRFDADVVETRKKLSQFIVLPIFQGLGLGGDMYRVLFETWARESQVVEIVVEDPNESFDDLRDRVDLTRLIGEGKLDLASFSLEQAQDPSFFARLKRSEKLEKRQLHRLLEMVLLLQLKANTSADSSSVNKKDVRLFVKKRLYYKNKEALEGMDEATRLDKLQTAYQALEDDYYRILQPVKLSAKRRATAEVKETKKVKV